MASPTQQTWVWASSRNWWWTGKPGMLQFMESQRVRHDGATELNWIYMIFPGGASGEEFTCQCRRQNRLRFQPCIGKITWRREWQPSPAFLPGKSHGQRSLVGYRPWGPKESEATKHTCNTVLSENTGKCYLVERKLVLCIPDSSLIREEKFGERNLKEKTIDFKGEM